MTVQIAVRLPEDLVQYVDRLVAEGAGSRAAVVARSLNLLQQQLDAEADARILEESGDYDDFDRLTEYSSIAD